MTAAQKRNATLKARQNRRREHMAAKNGETVAYMDRLDREQPGWIARLFGRR